MERTVKVWHVSKRFGDTQAVSDVWFALEPGEIFGLLGPNGAGKTTTTRIMLDIFKPDHGTVALLGGPMTESKKERVGYMPEERGLYQGIAFERCLSYLGTLKGLSTAEGHARTPKWLKRFELTSHRAWHWAVCPVAAVGSGRADDTDGPTDLKGSWEDSQSPDDAIRTAILCSKVLRDFRRQGLAPCRCAGI